MLSLELSTFFKNEWMHLSAWSLWSFELSLFVAQGKGNPQSKSGIAFSVSLVTSISFH